MHTLKNIAVGIISTLLFALAVRTGFQADKETGAAR